MMTEHDLLVVAVGLLAVAFALIATALLEAKRAIDLVKRLDAATMRNLKEVNIALCATADAVELTHKFVLELERKR